MNVKIFAYLLLIDAKHKRSQSHPTEMPMDHAMRHGVQEWNQHQEQQ